MLNSGQLGRLTNLNLTISLLLLAAAACGDRSDSKLNSVERQPDSTRLLLVRPDENKYDFCLADTDHNGLLNLSDIGAMSAQMGKNCTQVESQYPTQPCLDLAADDGLINLSDNSTYSALLNSSPFSSASSAVSWCSANAWDYYKRCTQTSQCASGFVCDHNYCNKTLALTTFAPIGDPPPTNYGPGTVYSVKYRSSYTNISFDDYWPYVVDLNTGMKWNWSNISEVAQPIGIAYGYMRPEVEIGEPYGCQYYFFNCSYDLTFNWVTNPNSLPPGQYLIRYRNKNTGWFVPEVATAVTVANSPWIQLWGDNDSSNVNLVFVGDQWVQLNNYYGTAYMNAREFTVVDPIIENYAPSINIIAKKSLSGLGCHSTIWYPAGQSGYLIACDESSIQAALVGAPLPVTKSVVLVEEPEGVHWVSNGGPTIYLTSHHGWVTSGGAILVHEFGHSFGGLPDLYNPQTELCDDPVLQGDIMCGGMNFTSPEPPNWRSGIGPLGHKAETAINMINEFNRRVGKITSFGNGGSVFPSPSNGNCVANPFVANYAPNPKQGSYVVAHVYNLAGQEQFKWASYKPVVPSLSGEIAYMGDSSGPDWDDTIVGWGYHGLDHNFVPISTGTYSFKIQHGDLWSAGNDFIWNHPSSPLTSASTNCGLEGF